jgi:hypothetical protein
MKNQQKIVVVGTGGTISSRYDPAKGRTVASQSVEDIVAMLPDRSALPPLEFQNFSTMASFEMTLDSVLQLVKHVETLLADPEVAGVVVAQGTDTMEETSFLADLLFHPENQSFLPAPSCHTIIRRRMALAISSTLSGPPLLQTPWGSAPWSVSTGSCMPRAMLPKFTLAPWKLFNHTTMAH